VSRIAISEPGGGSLHWEGPPFPERAFFPLTPGRATSLEVRGEREAGIAAWIGGAEVPALEPGERRGIDIAVRAVGALRVVVEPAVEGTLRVEDTRRGEVVEWAGGSPWRGPLRVGRHRIRLASAPSEVGVEVDVARGTLTEWVGPVCRLAGDCEGAEFDAAVADAGGVGDGGVGDAGAEDASLPDIGAPDGSALDAGERVDATAPTDAARDGAMPGDAALPDAVVPDAALPDAALPDAALPDAALPDAALPVDAGKAPDVEPMDAAVAADAETADAAKAVDAAPPDAATPPEEVACDGLDEDADGVVDEGCAAVLWGVGSSFGRRLGDNPGPIVVLYRLDLASGDLNVRTIQPQQGATYAHGLARADDGSLYVAVVDHLDGEVDDQYDVLLRFDADFQQLDRVDLGATPHRWGGDPASWISGAGAFYGVAGLAFHEGRLLAFEGGGVFDPDLHEVRLDDAGGFLAPDASLETLGALDGRREGALLAAGPDGALVGSCPLSPGAPGYAEDTPLTLASFDLDGVDCGEARFELMLPHVKGLVLPSTGPGYAVRGVLGPADLAVYAVDPETGEMEVFLDLDGRLPAGIDVLGELEAEYVAR
jgi:hypothetical protein